MFITFGMRDSNGLSVGTIGSNVCPTFGISDSHSLPFGIIDSRDLVTPMSVSAAEVHQVQVMGGIHSRSFCLIPD